MAGFWRRHGRDDDDAVQPVRDSLAIHPERPENLLSLVLNTASVIVLLAAGLAVWEHIPPLALGYVLAATPAGG